MHTQKVIIYSVCIFSIIIRYFALTLDVTQLYTQAVERAIRDGVTCVFIIKVLIIGAPGSGKTSLRYLLLDLPPPPKRNSTPLASRAVRAISIHRVKADDSGTINTWKELDDESYLSFIAEEVKILELNPSPMLITAQPSIPFTSAVSESSTSQPFSSQEVSEREVTHPVHSVQDSCGSSADGSNESDSEDSVTPLPSLGSMVHTLAENMVYSPPTIPKSVEQKKTFVHLIDSGGQPSFVSLVPAFVRGSTVNIVVSKYNRSINDKLEYEYVKDDQHLRQPTELDQTQLESIEELIRILSSTKHSEKGLTSESKFLLVGTHADKHWSLFHQSHGGKNRWLKKSLGELKSMCIEINDDGDILLPINTLVTKGRDEVASSLRQKIIKACSNAKVDIPTRWYVFELELSGLAKKEERGVLGLAECVAIGESLRMKRKDVLAAIMFLDEAAICMYFKVIPDLVFTDPQCILSEVTEILNLGIVDFSQISSLYPFLSKLMASIRRLREQGLFSRELIAVLCSKYRVNVAGKCVYTVDDFLTILKHLLIVAPVSIDDEELFFLPSILPSSNKNVPVLDGELPPLVLHCHTKAMPLGLCTALFVALLYDALFSLLEIVGRDVVKLNCTLGGVVMLVEHHACLVIHFNGDPSVAPVIRAAIHRAIAEVCKERHLDTSKIAFTDGFWCPFKKCESIPHPCKVNVSTGWLTCSVRPARGSGPYTNERMLAWLAPVPDNGKSIITYHIVVIMYYLQPHTQRNLALLQSLS